MSTQTVQVEGMTCGHCASSVREEIGRIDGVSSVDVELATGRVTITSAAPVDTADVGNAVTEAGYRVSA